MYLHNFRKQLDTIEIKLSIKIILSIVLPTIPQTFVQHSELYK